MRWCCRLMTRDTAICMLPNTATTSSFLSSKDGAPKFWVGGNKTKPSRHSPEAVSQGTAHIVLLGAPPEVDPSGVAGDVEHGQALQARQRHGYAVALRRHRTS